MKPLRKVTSYEVRRFLPRPWWHRLVPLRWRPEQPSEVDPNYQIKVETVAKDHGDGTATVTASTSVVYVGPWAFRDDQVFGGGDR